MSQLGAWLLLVVFAAGPTHAGPVNPAKAARRAPALSARPAPRPRRTAATQDLLRRLPPGTIVVPIESIEGVVLAHATLHGIEHDTSGVLVVDTGAGYLGLDTDVALRLGVHAAPERDGFQLASGALPRLELGGLQMDQVSPVLLLDTDIVRHVTGRDVIGLLGQHVFAGRAVSIDYAAGRMFLVPVARAGGEDTGDDPAAPDTTASDVAASRAVLAPLLGAAARAVPFRLAGDHKMLVRARFRDAPGRAAGPWLTLVFDTGATKTVLFEPALARLQPGAAAWRSVRGLIAPTLLGSPDARLALAPVVELDTGDGVIVSRDVDCAVMESGLADALSAAVGETVAGLVGYSLFERYRVSIDYPHRVLWLDPAGKGAGRRPYEYSHVGLQLERDGDAVRVMAIAEGSPAAVAGIAVGDTLLRIGTRVVRGADVTGVADALEGAPGTRVSVVVRHDGIERRYRLVRKRLL